MKKTTLTVLSLFTACCAVGQTVDNPSPPDSDFPALFIMPYGGYMMSFANSTDQLWQYGQLAEPSGNVRGWDNYVDEFSLIEQPTVQDVESSPVFGVELGLRFDHPDKDRTKSYLSVGIEYQERDYTGYQQYDNGTVVGEHYMEGTEKKVTARVNLNQTVGLIAFHMGIWYRHSNLSDRNVLFRSYRDGQMEYEEQVYPYTDPSIGYTVDDEWYTTRSGVGISLGLMYEPTDYARIFVRYEFSHIPTTDFSGGWFEYGRNGLDTHTLTVGVGVPIYL